MKAAVLETKEVKVGDRIRSNVNENSVKDLIESIRKFGQLAPILLDEDNNLIAGERRLRACEHLEIAVLAVYKDKLDEETKLEMELEENTCRSDLPPLEQSVTRARLHKAWATKNERIEWGLRQSAARLNIGKSQLADDVKIATYATVMPDKFSVSMTKNDMLKVIAKLERQLEFDVKLADLETSGQMVTLPPKVAKSFEPIRASIGDDTVPDAPLEPEPIERMSQEESKALILKNVERYKAGLMLGDALEGLAAYAGDPINIVLLDPPYGMEHQKKMDRGRVGGKRYEDTADWFTGMFPDLVKLCWDKMAEESHLYCFFSITHHEFVYSTLEKQGFMINRIPIVVKKSGVRSTMVPSVWPASTYEVIAFARKGKRKLVVEGREDCLLWDWITRGNKMDHPWAKPPSIYKELLERSAHPGDIICDPMYGTGAAFVACEQMEGYSLRWFGWDTDKDNKTKSMLSLTQNLIDYYGIQV